MSIHFSLSRFPKKLLFLPAWERWRWFIVWHFLSSSSWWYVCISPIREISSETFMAPSVSEITSHHSRLAAHRHRCRRGWRWWRRRWLRCWCWRSVVDADAVAAFWNILLWHRESNRTERTASPNKHITPRAEVEYTHFTGTKLFIQPKTKKKLPRRKEMDKWQKSCRIPWKFIQL